MGNRLTALPVCGLDASPLDDSGAPGRPSVSDCIARSSFARKLPIANVHYGSPSRILRTGSRRVDL